MRNLNVIASVILDFSLKSVESVLKLMRPIIQIHVDQEASRFTMILIRIKCLDLNLSKIKLHLIHVVIQFNSI